MHTVCDRCARATGRNVSKIVIDVDEDLLAYAAEVLGTRSERETVEAALRASVRPTSLDPAPPSGEDAD